ncbi:MAG: hypothetical protein ACI8QS_000350 [Planctomycetota bacterium]|jgi:hypothetical protein
MILPLQSALLLPLLVPLLGSPGAPEPAVASQERRADEVASRLLELGDASLEVRSRAERWLGAHLGDSDSVALANAARVGGAEVQRRLSLLLAHDARLLTTAALLLSNGDAAVRSVGEEAVRASAGRYFPVEAGTVAQGGELERQLELLARQEMPWALALDPTAPLELVVERMRRERGLPFALVIEPGTSTLSDRPRDVTGEPMVGSWERLLVRFARARDVQLECYGLPTERAGGLSRAAVLHVGASGGRAGGYLANLALGWVRAAQDEDARIRRQGLRALAASRWPAGLIFVERRFLAGEPLALEALLLAASEGRVVRSLFQTEQLESILRTTARLLGSAEKGALDKASEAARRLLSAYLGRGCLGVEDEALSAPLLRILRESNQTVSGEDLALNWLCLGLLEALQCGAPEVGEALVQLLSSGDLDPALRLQALRAFVVAPGTRPDLGGVVDLQGMLVELTLAGQPSRSPWRSPGPESATAPALELAGLLWAAGLEPPASLANAGAGMRQLNLAWTLSAGMNDRAAAQVSVLLDSVSNETARRRVVEEVGLILARAVSVGHGATVRSVLEGAGKPSDSLAEVALLSGLLSREEREVLVPRIPRDNFALRAAIAGTPLPGGVWAKARRELLEELAQAMDADQDALQASALLRAHEFVLEGLWSAPSMGLSNGELHAAALRRLLMDKYRSRLSGSVRQRGWPLPPNMEPAYPGSFDRMPPGRLLAN